jgi:hypothetical protein
VACFFPGDGLVAKTGVIIFRVDPETKGRIEAAARRSGKSITSFILEAAERAARKAEAMPAPTFVTKPRGRGACPTYFLALCEQATLGGENGYYRAGHELMRHVKEAVSWEVDESERDAKLKELGRLMDAQSDEAILAWFDREVPRCMQLVPRRRRASFLRGVYAMIEQHPSILET